VPRIRLAAMLALVCVAGHAHAQELKIPPVMRIVVPFSPGASNDVIARVLAPQLAKRLGNSVIVENRPGAAGAIGADTVAKGPRDGSQILVTSSTFLTAAATQAKQPYDALTAFAPVAMIGRGPLLLAVPAATALRTPAELIAAARARPGALNFGSAGIGSIGQMATELLTGAAGIQMTHVPYKGAANAVLELATGDLTLLISNHSTLAPQVQTGRVREIAVTSPQASAAFPDLPAVATVVPGFAVEIWVGVFAPAGTPPALVERLNREVNEIATSPELKIVLDPDGTVPQALSPTAFAAYLRDDLALWKRIATERKISVD
jgi:tripartite-type tricarboxylate transporter receptor subunit TctC